MLGSDPKLPGRRIRELIEPLGFDGGVKDFQEFWGSLTADGIVGALTWTALWS